MLPDTVLLVTASYDIAADYVSRELTTRQVPWFRLNTDTLPTATRATFDPREGFALRTGDEELLSEQVKSVWYRRNVKPDLPDDLDLGMRDFCEREIAAFLSGILASLDTARWLSHPSAIFAAERKPYQLHVAAGLGFEIPATIITNDPEALKEFRSAHRLVAKAVSSGYIPSDEGHRAIFTSIVSDEDLQDLAGLELAPVIFQELIEKVSDIRVTVVGGNIFAAEILSQAD